MWAIFSDIHANLEALEAVLADIDSQPAEVDRILCLGDTLGYGPSPCECLDLVRQRCDVVLSGNHDEAVLSGADGYGQYAAQAVLWHRKQIGEGPRREDRWVFLDALPIRHEEGALLFVHGSARNPLYEYVFPEDIYNPRKMCRVFDLIDCHCFAGHTHFPGVFVETAERPNTTLYDVTGQPRPDVEGAFPEGLWAHHAPKEIDYVYVRDRRKAILNVGSVGQPRDGDWRACYVLLDGPNVIFRRVPYDVEKTIRKIRAIPDLNDFLGDRLGEGR
jgi:predicted phosphodiesterase